jgi:molybdate transport system substrate-binding protein
MAVSRARADRPHVDRSNVEHAFGALGAEQSGPKWRIGFLTCEAGTRPARLQRMSEFTQKIKNEVLLRERKRKVFGFIRPVDRVDQSIKFLAVVSQTDLITLFSAVAKNSCVRCAPVTVGRKCMLRMIMAALITVMAGAASAADVKVLAALVLQDALDPLVAGYVRESGHTVALAYSTVGAIRRRLADGEHADMVVLTTDAIDEMARNGEVAVHVRVAATLTGVAVREGAAVPDVSTLEKFRAALLGARSIAYTDPKTGGAFGTYLAQELERLGLAQALNAKAVLRRGSHEIVAAVASGEAELGITFVSTIVSTRGVKVAGRLPPPLLGSERFSAGVLRDGAAGEAAAALVRALGDAEAAKVWIAKGFEAASNP